MAKIKFSTTAQGEKFYPVTITDAVVHINGSSQTKLVDLLHDVEASTNGTGGKSGFMTAAQAEQLANLVSVGGEVNVIETVKVNGTALTPDSNKAVNVTVAEGTTDGTIAVNGTDVAVKNVKTKQTAVSDPTASGTGITFIATAEQNANGEITVTKKTVQSASDSQPGLMSATHYTKLEALPTNATLETNLAAKADKVSGMSAVNAGNFAGLDANGNLTNSGSKAADFDAAGAAAAVLGTSSDAATDNTVYGAKALSNANKADVIGTNADLKTDSTIYGAKAYADDAVATALQGLAGALIYKDVVNGTTKTLPETGAVKGDVYVVSVAGTYDSKACEVGDYLIYNGASWDAITGENQVSNDNTALTIGTSVKVATVDGTEIYVQQVEDMTKIEAADVADTTEYADVTSLFTAPSGD